MHVRPRFTGNLVAVVMAFVFGLVASVAQASMVELDEAGLQDVSGTGIALAMDNFQFAMAPTSYFEMVGSDPSNKCTATGAGAGNQNCWRRGDLRWFGLNMSSITGTGYHWDDVTTCTASSIDCPRGSVIDEFSPFDNPYVLRAWSPQGMDYGGGCINGDDGAGGCSTAISNTTKSVYEYLAPTSQPYYKFSFIGEIEAGTTRNTFSDALSVAPGYILKSQTIIQGNAAGSVFRLFQFTEPGNRTFAMFYHSRLRGDFRFSVGVPNGTADTVAQPRVFSGTEGLYFRNVDAYFPIGQLYYQAMVVGQVGTTGAYYFDMPTPLPNNATVYDKHYSFRASDTRGYETARCNIPGVTCAADPSTTNYLITHGYSRWGSGNTISGVSQPWAPNWNSIPASGRNSASETNDGIFFRSCSSCATFYAYAFRPYIIDKRSPDDFMSWTQYYNCNTGNTGGCTVPTTQNLDAGEDPPNYPIDGGARTNVYPGGPVQHYYNTVHTSRTYPVTAGNAVNLGDARIEGLMINRLRMTTCTGGNCP